MVAVGVCGLLSFCPLVDVSCLSFVGCCLLFLVVACFMFGFSVVVVCCIAFVVRCVLLAVGW